MGEIETQPRRLDYRAGLLHVFTQHLLQRSLQQVCRRMVAPRRAARLFVDLGADRFVKRDGRESTDFADVQASDRRVGRQHFRQRARARFVVKDALIACLAAGFGVERCWIYHDLRLDAGRQLIDGRTSVNQRLDRSEALQLVVTDEARFELREQVLIDRRDVCLFRALPACAGPFALLLHGLFEACDIDAQPQLAPHLLLFVQRHAIGVVELEGGGSGQYAAGRGFRLVVEVALGHLERRGVALLLVLDDARHPLNGLHHLRIRRLHQFGDEAGEPVKEHLLHADHAGVAQRAAHDLAQHVAAALVQRNHAIVDQKRGRAGVVGTDAQHGVRAGVAMVRFAE